jgi:hypothetical protein
MYSVAHVAQPVTSVRHKAITMLRLASVID